MFNSVRFHLGFLACLLLHLALPAPSTAQERDTTATTLAAARQNYETRLDQIRDKIRSAIESKEKEARAAKEPDRAVIDAIQQMRTDFEASGAWPDVKSTAALRQDAARAAESMKAAYKAAHRQNIKAEQDELAGSIEEDIRVFSLHSDIVPWGPNLIAPKEWTAISTDASSRRTLDLKLPRGTEYRLEILAKLATKNAAPPPASGPDTSNTSASNTAALNIDIPLPSGNLLPIRATPDDTGELRVILTVGEGAIAADLGVTRPIDLDAAKDGEHLTLRTDSSDPAATFDILSVRVKPMIAGEPESLAAKPAPSTPTPKSKPGTTDPTSSASASKNVDDWLPRKGVWRGTKQDQDDRDRHDCTVKISRDDNVVVLHVNMGQTAMNITCRLDGDRLTVTGAHRTKGRGPTIRAAAGTGRVYEDHIELKYNWRTDGPKVKNKVVDGTISAWRSKK